MFVILILIGVFCTLAEVSSDERRFIDQVNNVRRELSYVISDISTLMKDVQNTNQTIWSKNKETRQIKDGGNSNSDGIISKKLDRKVSIKDLTMLLAAFESEKRLNRELQLRLIALEKSHVDVLKRIEFEENRSNKLEDSHTKLQKGLETERQLRQQVRTDLEKKIESEENRSNELEASRADLQKEFKTEKLLRQQIQDDIDKIEGEVSEFYIEVVENMTILMKHEDCVPEKTTTDLSISTGVVPDEKERDMATTASLLTPCISVRSSGVYDMYFSSLGTTKSVYCDTDTDGGDWIVTMRRQDGSVDFNRNWGDYKNGFGSVDGEFWIGNDVLHELTKSGPKELRVDMEDFEGNKKFAKYERFQIGSEADKYILSVSNYSGTAGDSMNIKHNVHNGMKFSTKDSDNDKDNFIHCARDYPGGWWFYYCFRSLLTGTYSHTKSIDVWQGVIWYTFTGDDESLKFVEMKVR